MKLIAESSGKSLGEIVSLFPREVLVSLKSECGGIQTLIKNCKQLFVVKGGMVRIRDWSIGSEDTWNPNPDLFKTRLCNFVKFFPSGCVRESQDCPFAHSSGEMRENVPFRSKRRKIE